MADKPHTHPPHWHTTPLSIALAAACACTLPQSAPAQSVSGGNVGTAGSAQNASRWDDAKQNGAISIKDRDRRAFLPDGITLGNYIASIETGASVVYDDNVFGAATNRKSDTRLDTSALIQLRSRLPRHVLNFSFGGRLARYLDNTELNNETGSAAIDGALHINRAHTAFFEASTALQQGDQIAIDAPEGARELTPIWRNSLRVGLSRDAGRLHGSISASAVDYNFYDVRAFDGSTIDQDTRDFTIYSGRLNTRYRISPGYTALFSARYYRSETAPDASETGNLDANGYEIVGGLSAEITRLFKGSVLAGYGQRDYIRQGIADASSLTVEANLEWLPTQLLTISASARHGLTETPATFSTTTTTAYQSTLTALALRADYELQRNLILNAGAEYRLYQDLFTAREDNIYLGRIGLDYLHAKNWLFSVSYEHLLRQSTESDTDLERNRIWVTAKLRF